MTKMIRPVTPAELAKHVRDLANAFNVILMESEGIKPEEGAAVHLINPTATDQRMNIVQIHPVVDETTYAIALHELGHCVHALGCLTGERRMSLRITMEEAAWEWARYYSLIWTTAMEQVERFGLGSYREKERREREEAERRSKDVKRFIKKVLR